MRYLRVVEERGRYVASLSEAPAPTPARGEVLIRVTASGVNRADLSQIAGRYPPPPGESEILGLEVSGTLDETGEPVCALLAGGGHAECVAAPAGQVFRAPAWSRRRAALTSSRPSRRPEGISPSTPPIGTSWRRSRSAGVATRSTWCSTRWGRRPWPGTCRSSRRRDGSSSSPPCLAPNKPRPRAPDEETCPDRGL